MATKAAERARDDYWYRVVYASVATLGLFVGMLGVLSEMRKDSLAAVMMMFVSAFMTGISVAAFTDSLQRAAAIRSMGTE